MPRIVPPDRLWNVIDVAAEVFIAQGYQRTQMSDVADGLGVAVGTLYNCVESKAALFDVAVTCADGHVPLPTSLPLPTPAPGATLKRIRKRLSDGLKDLALLAALAQERPPDVRAEFDAIVHDFYGRLESNRRSIKIVDRCAADQPDLAAAWFGEGRAMQQRGLAEYLARRVAQGLLRPVPDVQVAARVVLETIVFWAVHRHWDPAPQEVREEEIPSVLADLLFGGLAKERAR